MPERSLTSRTILMLTAALQLAVPGAASWADARLEAEGRMAPVHIESHSTSSCVHIHPSDCGLCRFLCAPFAGAPTRRVQVSLAVQVVSVPLDSPAPRAARWRSSSRPRAPPALS